MSVASNVEKEDNYLIFHHFLRSIYGLGETTAHLHSDNCTGTIYDITGLLDKSKDAIVIHA